MCDQIQGRPHLTIAVRPDLGRQGAREGHAVALILETPLQRAGVQIEAIGHVFHTQGQQGWIPRDELFDLGGNVIEGSVGWNFAYDYFDAGNPISPLAKLFVSEFKKEYGGDSPDFYAANFYENTLVMWELIRRIKKYGGNLDGHARGLQRAA